MGLPGAASKVTVRKSKKDLRKERLSAKPPVPRIKYE